VEIGPTHLTSAGRRVLVGHGPPAKWPAPRAGALGRPSPPDTVLPCHPQTSIVSPFSRPRRRPQVHLLSLSTAAHGLSSKPSPLSPPHLAPPLPPHMHRRCADDPGIAPAQAPTLMSPCAHTMPLTRARRRAVVCRKEWPQRPWRCRLLPRGCKRRCRTPPVPVRSRRRLLELHPAPTTSMSLLAPTPTTPLAPYRWATPPKKCRRRLPTRVRPPSLCHPKISALPHRRSPRSTPPPPRAAGSPYRRRHCHRAAMGRALLPIPLFSLIGPLAHRQTGHF
jgi:hypothetical protein